MSSDFHPLVSIVIPVYNGANYLREAIDSALSQSYDNIEIIVVNDGSEDSGATESIAKSYGNKIRYFAKNNGGVASALNLGLQEMKGEYFAWLSHDDIHISEKTERQIKCASEGAKFIFGGYEVINADGNSVGTVLSAHAFESSHPKLLYYRGLVNGCTVLIHKSLFQEFGDFDVSRRTTQDYACWASMLKVVQPVYINEVLCKTRVHDDQGSRKIQSHAKEADDLWTQMLSDLTEEECCSMMASAYAFFNSTALFLKSTPYSNAQKKAEYLATEYYSKLKYKVLEIKVSVIIPFYNRLNLVLESVQSVILQTHKNIEIVLVDDGSSEDVRDVCSLVSQHSNIKLVRIAHSGRSAARNAGIAASTGDYIAFLDSDDLFMPNKIEAQLYEMLVTGMLASHSSYIRFSPNVCDEHVVKSGLFTGSVYPSILANCPIATPTVMLRRDIVPNDLFPEDVNIGEDTIAWIKIANHNQWLGVDMPLTKVLYVPTSTFMNLNHLRMGLVNILSYIVNHPDHSRYDDETLSLLNSFSGLYNNSDSSIDSSHGFVSRYKVKVYNLYAHCLRYGIRSAIKKVVQRCKKI